MTPPAPTICLMTSHEATSRLADAKPSSKTRALQCSRCGKEFLTEEEILFCNACGSPLHAAGTVNTVSVVLAEDASVSRRKIAAMLKRLGCRMTEVLNGLARALTSPAR